MRVCCALIMPLLWGPWGVYPAEVLAWFGAGVFLMFGCYRRLRILEQKA